MELELELLFPLGLLHGMSVVERMVFMDESRRKLYLGSAKTLWSYDIFHPKEHGVNTDEVFEIAEENKMGVKN